MNQEKLHQSLSALMDGEAGELELRQVLKQSETNDELRQTWRRWQIARAVLHGEAQSFASVDLSARVSAALSKAPVAPMSRRGVARSGRLWRAVGQCAVAAGVTLAVLGGVRFYQSSQTAAHPALQAQQSAAPFKVPFGESPQLVGYGVGGASRAPALSAPPLWSMEREWVDWQAERLPGYLHKHYQQGGFIPGLDGVQRARAASFIEP